MAQLDQKSLQTDPPSGGGFAVWLKRLKRFFRSRERHSDEAHLKHDINKLEQERQQEKTALLKQRRFYENLLRRRTRPSMPTTLYDKPHEPAPIDRHETLSPLPKPEAIAPPEKPLPPPAVHIEARAPVADKPPVASVPLAPLEKKSEITLKPKPAIGFSFFGLKPKLKSVPAAASIAVPETSAVKPTEKKSLRSRLAEKLAIERESEEEFEQKNEVEERFWQPYGGVKTNLVKDQGVLFFNWQQRLLTLCLALVLCSLALSLIYVGLLVWQKERLDASAATFANFDAINVEISKNEKDIQEIVGFNRKLELVSFILSNHVYWSNFLAFLEDHTLKDVYLESFGGDLEGTYTIPAIARNLDTVSLQLEVYKAYNKMRSVTYANAQTSQGTEGSEPVTRFNLQMSLDPSVFTK